jgi:hypothetical protein
MAGLNIPRYKTPSLRESDKMVKAETAPERSGSMPALVMVAAVGVLALPSAVLAFSTRIEEAEPAFSGNRRENQGMGSFAPGRADPRLQRAIASTADRGPLFRFTPAGLAARPDRSVPVAVRVDAETARAIVVRGVVTPPASRLATNANVVRIAPTAYNLGLSRGYQGFSGLTPSLSLSNTEARRQDLPDLSTFPRADNSASDARLVPHIAVGEREKPGRAPRTLEGVGEQSVDLGGSYRVTGNLNVTAGVRYSQDRDRLKPVPDAKTDAQAVFVGTQFHF